MEAELNVSLTAELEDLVAKKVKTSMYQASSDVIREGPRLLKGRDYQIEGLRRDIRDGFAAVERGEYTDYDAKSAKSLGDEIKDRRQRLAWDK